MTLALPERPAASPDAPSPEGIDARVSDTLRSEALSDGVFAIAMTLLVLDLRTPPHQPGMLPHALGEQWPAYLSFIASFLFIGVIWTNHHATFRQIPWTDRAVTWANLGILCGAVLLPFPTAVLADAFRTGSRADEQTAAVLYASVAVFASMVWLVLFLILHRHRYPIQTDQTLAPWRAQIRRPVFGSLGYLGGAMLGLTITPTVSLLGFVLIPIYYALTSEGLRDGQKHTPTASPRTGDSTGCSGLTVVSVGAADDDPRPEVVREPNTRERPHRATTPLKPTTDARRPRTNAGRIPGPLHLHPTKRRCRLLRSLFPRTVAAPTRHS